MKQFIHRQVCCTKQIRTKLGSTMEFKVYNGFSSLRSNNKHEIYLGMTTHQGRIQDLIKGGAQIVTGLKLPFWGLSFVEFWCWASFLVVGGPRPPAPPGSAPAHHDEGILCGLETQNRSSCDHCPN